MVLRSVPRVFIGGKFVGGGTEARAADKSGELGRLLEAAGAEPRLGAGHQGGKEVQGAGLSSSLLLVTMVVTSIAFVVMYVL